MYMYCYSDHIMLCKAIKNDSALLKNALLEMNDCHMTCIIAQTQIIVYPLVVIYLIFSCRGVLIIRSAD